MELLCKGHFRLLFALLKYGDDKDMQMLTLEVGENRVERKLWRCALYLHLLQHHAAQVIASVSGNQECVADIAESMVLPYLLFALEHVPAGGCGCVCLFPLHHGLQLINTPAPAAQVGKRLSRACMPWCRTRRSSSRPSRAVDSGPVAVVFVTPNLTPSPMLRRPYLPAGPVLQRLEPRRAHGHGSTAGQDPRRQAARAQGLPGECVGESGDFGVQFASLQQHNPFPLSQVRILLNKFLPTIFMDAMRDNPESSVTMFEGLL